MVKQAAYSLFETPLGTCAIAWNERGVIAFQLPEATKKQTEERIAKRASAIKSAVVPKRIATIIKQAQKHFGGEAQNFQDVAVDLDGTTEFSKQVYDICQSIPAGKTMTYGEIAKAMNRPAASRAVGRAMGMNPIPLIIPCHRVLASGNKPGGFSAFGGFATKLKMLNLEGAALGSPSTIVTLKDLKRAAALLKRKDPRLSAILSRPIEFRLRPEHSPYQTLVEAVVHQQLSPKAASTILGRVMDLYPGSKIPKPAELLKTPDERLRSAGLSRSKAKALKDIAAKTLDGTVPSSKDIISLTNEEIVKRLTSIYGVGQWTVEMMLIFNLGRTDVWPVDDFALRKIAAEVFKLKTVPTPKQLHVMGEAWRPYRTVASLYIWNCGNS
jgi:DNA-3-methyladenine glycosylase II